MAKRIEKKKEKLILEYTINVSPSLLYQYLYEPTQLQEWFADEVNVENKNRYVFQWKSSNEMQAAQLLDYEKDVFLRFKWENDEEEDTYLEFRIITTQLSQQTILQIEDFTDPGDADSQHQLWDYQIKTLMHILGN